MRLYFLRHGIAEDAAPGQSDAARKLTEEGRTKMRQEAKFLSRLGLKMDAVYSSPYPRALETAQIVQECCKYPDIIQDARLASGAFGLGELQQMVQEYSTDARILFVGHQPDLSIVVQYLCGAVIEMKKGSIACVETSRPEPDGGGLLWLLAPAVMRIPDEEEE